MLSYIRWASFKQEQKIRIFKFFLEIHSTTEAFNTQRSFTLETCTGYIISKLFCMVTISEINTFKQCRIFVAHRTHFMMFLFQCRWRFKTTWFYVLKLVKEAQKNLHTSKLRDSKFKLQFKKCNPIKPNVWCVKAILDSYHCRRFLQHCILLKT